MASPPYVSLMAVRYLREITSIRPTIMDCLVYVYSCAM